jgi:hypothetical protein
MACSFSGTPDRLHLARFARARLRGLISEAAKAAMLAENGAWAWPILLACADARAPHRQALVPLARVPRSGDGTQAGDPAKAAQAILAALDAPVPPLRLVLGGDAIDSIRQRLESLTAELAQWEPLGRDTAIDT